MRYKISAWPATEIYLQINSFPFSLPVSNQVLQLIGCCDLINWPCVEQKREHFAKKLAPTEIDLSMLWFERFVRSELLHRYRVHAWIV